MQKAYRDMVEAYSERYRFAAYSEDFRDEYPSSDSDYSLSESEHEKYVSAHLHLRCIRYTSQVRIQDLRKGGARARFCRHRIAELRRRQKFGPQNWGQGRGPGPPPPRSAPASSS